MEFFMMILQAISPQALHIFSSFKRIVALLLFFPNEYCYFKSATIIKVCSIYATIAYY